MNKRLRKHAASLPPGALVRVVWIDADNGPGTWCTAEEALDHPPSVVVTTGHVVGVRNGLFVVASDRAGDALHSVGRIPLTWLTHINVIEEPFHG